MIQLIQIYIKKEKILLTDSKQPVNGMFLIYEREIKEEKVESQDFIFEVKDIIDHNYDPFKEDFLFLEKYYEFIEKKEVLERQGSKESFLKKELNSTEEKVRENFERISDLTKCLYNIYIDFKDYGVTL